MNCGIIDELQRELQEASTSLQQLLEQRPNSNNFLKSLTCSPSIARLLSEIETKSNGALEQCQQLNRLHSQLQSIKATQTGITSLNRAQVTRTG
jgi:hypothetical protein